MRHISIITLSIFIATSAAAQEVPDGCFVGAYSKEHLKAHPDQVVERMSILFSPTDADGFGWADVQVLLANQGHAARRGNGGMRLSAAGTNWKGSTTFDSTSCDGGAFEIVASDEDSITIETYRFQLGAGCGEEEGISSDMGLGLYDADGGLMSTRYRLNRAEANACNW